MIEAESASLFLCFLWLNNFLKLRPFSQLAVHIIFQPGAEKNASALSQHQRGL
jgi:hypothetical protein